MQEEYLREARTEKDNRRDDFFPTSSSDSSGTDDANVTEDPQKS